MASRLGDWSGLKDDNVELDDGRRGIIRYIGAIQGRDGIWYGIELSTAHGKNDGKISGMRYFKTKPRHACFVRKRKIKRVSRPTREQRAHSQPAFVHIANNPSPDPRFIPQNPSHIPYSPYGPNPQRPDPHRPVPRVKPMSQPLGQWEQQSKPSMASMHGKPTTNFVRQSQSDLSHRGQSGYTKMERQTKQWRRTRRPVDPEELNEDDIMDDMLDNIGAGYGLFLQNVSLCVFSRKS